MNSYKLLAAAAGASLTLTGCISKQVRKAERSMAETVGDSPASFLQEQIESVPGFTYTAPRGGLAPGDLLLKVDGSRYLDAMSCFLEVPVREEPLGLAQYGRTDWGAGKLHAGDISGVLGDVRIEGGAQVKVEARVSGARIEAVDLGSLRARETCLADLAAREAAGAPISDLQVVAEVIVADEITVGSSVRRGISADAVLRPVVADLEASGLKGSMSELGYRVTGPVVIGYKLRNALGVYDASAEAE